MIAMMNVRQYYAQALRERGYQEDAAQRMAIERLQHLYDDFLRYQSQRGNRLMSWLRKPEAPKGVYMWGGVGRGKSFLMDAFFHTVPSKKKARLHFHEFMRGVHQELDQVKGTSNPLDEVASRIADRYNLICFDEFHVSDVADAMILHRLLQALYAHGIAFVMTSNYEPSTLYPDGLHRDRILPAIALIQQRMDVINVDAGNDYRRRELEQVKVYYWPLDAQADVFMGQAFDGLNTTEEVTPPALTLSGRRIKAQRLSRNVAWFDFATLCGGPRSQNDYLDLANRYGVILLSGVPEMGPRQASEARRFTWLVDVLYDHKVKLIISAAVEPEQLYTQGALANEFHRTVSRLVEMQSQAYLDEEQREAAKL